MGVVRERCGVSRESVVGRAGAPCAPGVSSDDEVARRLRAVLGKWVKPPRACGASLITPVNARRESRRMASDIKLKAVRVPNTAVVLCRAGPGVPLVSTLDPFDRAHGVLDAASGMNKLLPAVRSDHRGRAVGKPIAQSVPRRYPASYMTGYGVSMDSVYDRTFEVRRELDLDDEHEEAVPDARAMAMDRLGAIPGSGRRSGRVGVASLRPVRKKCPEIPDTGQKI